MSGGRQGSRGSAGQSLAPTWDPAQGTEGEGCDPIPAEEGQRPQPQPPTPPPPHPPPSSARLLVPTPYLSVAIQSRTSVLGPVKWSYSTHLAVSRLGEMRVLSSFTLRRPRRRGGPRSPGINRTPRPKKAHSAQLTTLSLALPSWPVQPGLVPCGNGGAAGRGSEAEGSHGESR